MHQIGVVDSVTSNSKSDRMVSMVNKTPMRYTNNARLTMLETLQNWIDQTIDSIDADGITDARSDMLADRLNSLESAQDALESIDES